MAEYLPLNNFANLSLPLCDGALLVAQLVQFLLHQTLFRLQPLTRLGKLENVDKTSINGGQHTINGFQDSDAHSPFQAQQRPVWCLPEVNVSLVHEPCGLRRWLLRFRRRFPAETVPTFLSAKPPTEQKR